MPHFYKFAVDLTPGSLQTFHVLQTRPMFVERVDGAAAFDESLRQEAVVFSRSTLGHGRRSGIRDLIAIPWTLERSRTREAAAIEAINRALRQEGRTCLILGPGRWGSADPWLERQEARTVAMDGRVRHYRLEEPLVVLVDGARGTGAVVRATAAT